MKRFLLSCLVALVATSPLLAADLAELRDAIDNIESQIDDIDLDQSKDDIRLDLDEIKQALEELEGSPVVYESQDSKRLNYQLVPVKPKAPKAQLVKNPWPQSENLLHEND